ARSRNRDRRESPQPHGLVSARREPRRCGCARAHRRLRLLRDGGDGRRRHPASDRHRPAARTRLSALVGARCDRSDHRLRGDVPLRDAPAAPAGCRVAGPGGRPGAAGGLERDHSHGGCRPPSPSRSAHRRALVRAAQRRVRDPPVPGPRTGNHPSERYLRMIQRRSLLKALPAAAAGGLALSACGSSGGSGGSGGSAGPLTWMSMLHTPTTPDAAGPIMEAIKEHSGIDFEFQWVPDASNEEKLNAALASGSVADITSITIMTNSTVREAVSSGLFWDV